MTYDNLFIAVLTVLLACNIRGYLGLGWNYDGSDGELGPTDWKYNYSACGLNAQSPINIVTSSAVPISSSLTFSGYDKNSSSNFKVTNNGHSIQINVNAGSTISVRSSQLNGTYVLEQFHFHWGDANGVGSEHSMNGAFYPLEIHFVHYNSDKYSNVSQAASANDSSALLVIGVLATIANSNQVPSATIDSLVKLYDEVHYGTNQTVMSPFPLQNLLPCVNSAVYTYSGSLTTPGCAEVVNWNVFGQPIYISNTQLTKFRELVGSDPNEELNHNFRPTQPLNGRTVSYYNVPTATVCQSPPPGGANGAASVHFRPLFIATLLTITKVVVADL